MASAQIIFHQPNSDGYTNPGSRDDLLIYDGTNNTKITVQNVSNTGATSWQWTIIDKPSNSAAVFASSGTLVSTASTDTFNPDIVGTYLIKLVINSGSANDQKGAAVKTAKLHYRIPAATETIEFDGYRGWATATNIALKVLDDGYAAASGSPQTLQNIYTNSTPSSLTVNSTNGSVQIHDASSTIGNIFEVDAYGGGSKYLIVSPTQTTILGKFVSTGGQIGLGTTTPFNGYGISSDGQVHIAKTNHNLLLVDTATANSDAGLALFTATSSKHATLFLDESDSQKLKIALGLIDTHANRQTNTFFTMQQDGSIGVGTASPTSKLHIVGTGHFTSGVVLDGGFSASAPSSISGSNTSTGLNLQLTNTATSTASYSIVSAQGNNGTVESRLWADGLGNGPLSVPSTLIGSFTGHPLGLIINNTVKLLIAADGGIEIPASTAAASSANTGRIRYNTTTGHLEFSQNGAPYVAFGSGTGSYGNGVVADTSAFLLTTTSATPILSYTPPALGNYAIYIYYTVATTTNLTITATWNDGVGSQSFNIVPSGSQLTGSYNTAPVYIDANTSAITITATAGTSNNIAISASIFSLAVSSGVTARVNTFDLQLTGTSPTTIATLTPVVNGNHIVYIYYRVVNATTNVTVIINWTDMAGSQTMTVIPLTSSIVNSYSVPPIYIQAIAANAISVIATSGIANNLFVSATIISA